MLPLLLGVGIAAIALVAASRRTEAAPPSSTYPSGYEVHGYKSSGAQMEEMSRPSFDEARAVAEKLIAQGFDKVAIRYVPPGYVPGDIRSEAATSLRFAKPSDYSPWRGGAKSPREPREAEPAGGKVSGSTKFKDLTLDHIAQNVATVFKVAGSNQPQAIVDVRGGFSQMPTEYRQYVSKKAVELGAPADGVRMALFGLR